MPVDDTSGPARPPHPSRRTILKGVSAGIALAAGVSAPYASPANAHSTVAYSTIWGQRTYYNGSLTTFSYNTTFHTKLEHWLQFYYSETPSNWWTPIQLHLLGVHVDKPGMHQYGRAIDFQKIVFRNGNTGLNFIGFDCQYNVWRYYTGSALEVARRNYWAGVASLNFHFKYVLHYLYNAEHHNHVHADNEASGSNNSTFTTGTSSQVKFVQASLNYVWRIPTAIDGVWGPETNNNSAQALARGGYGGRLTDSQNHWLTYCRYTVQQGSGKVSY